MTKLAVIDIGTNSIHLLIAEVFKDKTFNILYKERDIVRLGEELGKDKNFFLKEEAIQRVIAKLKNFFIKINDFGVAKTTVAATSAVRSARNSNEFINKIKELGLDVLILSGEKEAKLIFYGVKTDQFFKDKSICVIDIGGGSTEIIIGNNKPEYVTSMDIGAVRLKTKFLHNDPPLIEQRKKLEEYIQTIINEQVYNLKDYKFTYLVGTSGVIFTLASILFKNEKELNNKIIKIEDIQRTVNYLYSINSKQRENEFNMHPLRADIIHAGGSILLKLMQNINCTNIYTCDRALREGLIIYSELFI